MEKKCGRYGGSRRSPGVERRRNQRVITVNILTYRVFADSLAPNSSGVLAEKPSDELFTIDTVGSEEVRKATAKKHKPLKSEEIIAQRSAIPAVDTRKRLSSKVTDGVIEPKTKKQKKDWVSRKDWLRLKQVAKENNPTNKVEPGAHYDPWADNEDPTPLDDPQFDFLEKPKPKVAPVTLKHAPISLAANGKPIPAVRAPNAGTSYNPTFEEWDQLLQEQGQKQVEVEQKRLEEEQKELERQRLIDEAKDDDGEVKSDDESAWEGFESEYEKPDWLKKKRPERKTKTERNKAKRRKEAERKAKWDAKQKRKEEQVAQAKAIAQKLQEQGVETKQDSDADTSDEGDETTLRRRPLGKTPYVILTLRYPIYMILTILLGHLRRTWRLSCQTNCRTLCVY